MLCLPADAESTSSKSPCGALLAQYGVNLGTEATTQDLPNGCVISNGAIATSTYQTWAFDRAEIKTDDFAGLAGGGNRKIPAWGLLSLEGVRFRIRSGNSVVNYINRLQQWPMDLDMSYHWDPQAGRLELDEARLSSVKAGLVALSGDFVLDGNVNAGAIPDPANVGVSRLRFRLDNQGLFEALAGPALSAYLAAQIGQDADLDAEVERLKALAVKSIGATPETVADGASRQALIRFVEDLPHPTGFFSVEVEFPKPLKLSDLSNAGDPMVVAKMLSAGKVHVRYTAR